MTNKILQVPDLDGKTFMMKRGKKVLVSTNAVKTDLARLSLRQNHRQATSNFVPFNQLHLIFLYLSSCDASLPILIKLQDFPLWSLDRNQASGNVVKVMDCGGYSCSTSPKQYWSGMGSGQFRQQVREKAVSSK